MGGVGNKEGELVENKFLKIALRYISLYLLNFILAT